MKITLPHAALPTDAIPKGAVPKEVRDLFDARLFSIGSAHITLASILTATIIVTLAVFAARLAGAFFARLRKRDAKAAAPLYIVEKLVTYGLVIFGVMFGLQAVGVNFSSLAVFAGAIGVGVGLGLQGVVREFVSGLVLIFDNALHVGNFIELSGSGSSGGAKGEVLSIGARATHVRTNDGVDILVPNSHLIDNAITNWTLRGATRRIHVPFSVAYGADKEKVRDAVLKAAHAVPFTLPDEGQRKTQVWMIGFGDSALNFELVVWPKLEAVKRPASMTAAYVWAIEDALRRAEIEMPFPQMDLRLRSLFGVEDADARKALKLAEVEAAPEDKPARRRAAKNDAAEDTLHPHPITPAQSDPKTAPHAETSPSEAHAVEEAANADTDR